MSKYLIEKYKKELISYSFPYDKYDKLINQPPLKNENFNETFNRSVFLNTPKEFYLNNNKLIYYDSLWEVDNNINGWIEVFYIKTKFADKESDIYLYYKEALYRIKRKLESMLKDVKKNMILILTFLIQFLKHWLKHILIFYGKEN